MQFALLFFAAFTGMGSVFAATPAEGPDGMFGMVTALIVEEE